MSAGFVVEICVSACHPEPGHSYYLDGGSPGTSLPACKMVTYNTKNERKIRSLVIKYKNIILILAVIWMGSFAYFRSGSGAAVRSIDPNRVRNILLRIRPHLTKH